MKFLDSSMICSLVEDDVPLLPLVSDVFAFESAPRVELEEAAKIFLTSFDDGFESKEFAALTFKSIGLYVVEGGGWQLLREVWLQRFSFVPRDVRFKPHWFLASTFMPVDVEQAGNEYRRQLRGWLAYSFA